MAELKPCPFCGGSAEKKVEFGENGWQDNPQDI